MLERLLGTRLRRDDSGGRRSAATWHGRTPKRLSASQPPGSRDVLGGLTLLANVRCNYALMISLLRSVRDLVLVQASSVTLTSCVLLPPRTMLRVIDIAGILRVQVAGRSLKVATAWPSIATMTSPGWLAVAPRRPALAAPLPGLYGADHDAAVDADAESLCDGRAQVAQGNAKTGVADRLSGQHVIACTAAPSRPGWRSRCPRRRPDQMGSPGR